MGGYLGGVGKGIDSPISTTNHSQTDDETMSDFPLSRGDTGTNTPVPFPPPLQHHQSLQRQQDQPQDQQNGTPGPPPSHPSAPAAFGLSSVSAEHNRAMLSAAFDSPLKGVKVVIIHVKDSFMDGPLVGTQILKELREGEEALQEQGKGLGCQFEVSAAGESYWF